MRLNSLWHRNKRKRGGMKGGIGGGGAYHSHLSYSMYELTNRMGRATMTLIYFDLASLYSGLSRLIGFLGSSLWGGFGGGGLGVYGPGVGIVVVVVVVVGLGWATAGGLRRGVGGVVVVLFANRGLVSFAVLLDASASSEYWRVGEGTVVRRGAVVCCQPPPLLLRAIIRMPIPRRDIMFLLCVVPMCYITARLGG